MQTEHYQNSKRKIAHFLKKWTNEIIAKNLWEKYENIHIDEIDSLFSNKKEWVDGSFFILNLLNDIIDKKKYDIFLTFQLSYVEKTKEINSLNLNTLVNELDFYPPSFYLFDKNNKNFESTLLSAKYINTLTRQSGFKAFYIEKIEGNEISRVLYFRI